MIWIVSGELGVGFRLRFVEGGGLPLSLFACCFLVVLVCLLFVCLFVFFLGGG